ncbi:ATP-binding protein [Metabacillus lacus]|uniref:ATP-binding protein n=1 Tax=Metabacillus lacus TaxID=1983721 RepID=UPI0014796894|nr:AAA family ATPase [Metabacillus lacus]
MKILEIDIYGYGKFENKTFTLDPGSINIFLGHNEAGKSTIQSFIGSMLFGFPAKNSAEKRYEPKQGGKYGGALVIQHEKIGRVRIERIAGKASGDVTVYYEDGSKGSEEDVRKLLAGVDKQRFKAIYSFDVHGLQGVHHVNSESIGRFLFLSSMFGSDAVFKLQSMLEREREQIFKPSGKKPPLNAALQKLKETNGALSEAKKVSSQYGNLLNTRKILEDQHTAISTRESKLGENRRTLERLLSIQPLAREEQYCLSAIDQTESPVSFPQDGLIRMERILNELKPLKSQLSAVQKQEAVLQEELEELQYRPEVLEKEEVVKALTQSFSLYVANLDEHSRQAAEAKGIQDAVLQQLSEHFPALSPKKLLEMDTSYPAREKAKNTADEFQQMLQEKRYLDEQFERSREALEEREGKVKDYEDQLLSPEKRQEMKTQLKKLESINTHALQAEYEENEHMLSALKADREKSVKKARTVNGLMILGGMIGSILFLLWDQYIPAAALLISLLLASFVINQLIKKENPYYDMLKKKQEALKNTFMLHPGEQSGTEKLQELESLLWKDEQMNQLLGIEKSACNQAEKTYERILKKYEEWEQAQFQEEEKAEKVKAELYLPADFPAGSIGDAFDLIAKLKEQVLFLKSKKETILSLQQQIDKYEKEVSVLAGELGLKTINTEAALQEVQGLVEYQKKQKQQRGHIQERLNECKEDIQKLSERICSLEEDMDTLYTAADAEGEEQFRARAEQHAKRKELQQRLEWIQQQLSQKGVQQEEKQLSSSMVHIEETLKDTEEELLSTRREAQSLTRELAAASHTIKELEKSGTYSEWMHQAELEREEAKELARKWAVKTLAGDLLHSAISYNRNVRLPSLIARAENYFLELTGGEYTALYLPEEEDTFLVERRDNLRFFPNELSQATSEQLYVSLRLALAAALQDSSNIPLLIDDSFVHFDRGRSGKMAVILEEISKEHQVIFFTCHESQADRFKSGRRIFMENTAVSST